MKFRGLIAAAVILLALAGVLYWSEHRQAKDEGPLSTMSPPIVRINPAAVTGLSVKQKAAPAVTLERSGAQWQITSPGVFPADSRVVSDMLTSLAPLNSQSVVDDHATNLAQFGLSDPAVELDITSKDNKTTRLLLGDDAPTGDGVYVTVAGNSRVFTASSFVKTSLSKTLSDLRDKRLLPIESSSVSSLDLLRKGDDIGFARIQNGWQIEKPKPYRTDNFQVDVLLQEVTSARWDASVSSEDAAKTYVKAAPVAIVKLTGSSGNSTLDVRKDNDDYYAKSSLVAGTWKVDSANASAFGQALGHTLDEFRNKQLFDFGDSETDKIEYRSGTTNLSLTRTGHAWSSNGRKMDPVSIESLLSALRNQVAARFVDSGFTAPNIEITVTLDGGKKVEKVQIQTSGDSAIARLDGDSSLYVLDAPTVTGLVNAIAAIQPAALGRK